ncbi:MAG TPA: HAD family phosphatase [Bacteroidia bacterium]|nr:HAD family phosphatase [Bacteroidia bacterium]
MLRNIIFDLGGVIINLDPAATEQAFVRLGMTDFSSQYSTAKQSGLFDDFDKGKISPEAFRTELKKYFPAPVTGRAIDEAWNAMLLDVPPERLELLAHLGKRYRLFLLSNTNEIHVAAFSAYLQREYGFSDFSGFFEKWYYSCRMGMRKPDREIFLRVLDENKLDPAETLFIDDSMQHVKGAAETGISSLWLAPGKTILDLVREKVF